MVRWDVDVRRGALVELGHVPEQREPTVSPAEQHFRVAVAIQVGCRGDGVVNRFVAFEA